MKINSSEIHYDSFSQFSQTNDETVYTMNDKGDVLYKDEKVSTQGQTTEASAYYQTRGRDSVTIRDEARTKSFARVENQGETGLDMDDDLERSMYVSSVLDWAADTIDLLVSDFQEREQDALGQRKIDTVQIWAGNDVGLNQKQVDQQISFYREMALEFREKADALFPRLTNDQAQATQLMRIQQTQEENTLVRAVGAVQTEDGKTIEFSLEVGMERNSEFQSYETIQLIDPLVINFGGKSAELSDQKMAFDLDGDGDTETIARLKSGSGFLALDLNQDNQINTGKELFGTASGDGFRDLSFYDQDQNHWIDENDEIYEKLLVWFVDDQGNDSLKSLSEMGIGAIHLGSVSSDFFLKDTQGETVGKVSATGVALTEEGAVASVQQIDLVV